MDSFKDLLQKKADGLDQKKNTLAIAQQAIFRHFPERVQVNKINENTVFLVVSNSSLASDVRLKQISLCADLTKALGESIERIVIRQSSR